MDRALEAVGLPLAALTGLASLGAIARERSGSRMPPCAATWRTRRRTDRSFPRSAAPWRAHHAADQNGVGMRFSGRSGDSYVAPGSRLGSFTARDLSGLEGTWLSRCVMRFSRPRSLSFV